LAADVELSLSEVQLRAACHLAASRSADRVLLAPEPIEAAVLHLAARRIRNGECVRHGQRMCATCAGPHTRTRIVRPSRPLNDR
jgi:hypothetical protein